MSNIANFVNFGCDNLNALALEILTRLENKYGEPSCGRNRAAFTSKHCVIKFPLNFDGLHDNSIESKKYSDGYASYAKGRKIMLGDFNCVVQEKLTMPEKLHGLPTWVMSIDCCQVGYDVKGRLKAYDFGS